MDRTGDLVKSFILAFVAVFVITFISFLLFAEPMPPDITDPPNARSGLRTLVDAETGCQYLTGIGGGITPRVDKNGKHLCNL